MRVGRYMSITPFSSRITRVVRRPTPDTNHVDVDGETVYTCRSVVRMVLTQMAGPAELPEQDTKRVLSLDKTVVGLGWRRVAGTSLARTSFADHQHLIIARPEWPFIDVDSGPFPTH